MVREDESFLEFCEFHSDRWRTKANSLRTLQSDGWTVGAASGYGYAAAPKSIDLGEASEAVARAVGVGAPFELRSDRFRCGGCFAGELPIVPSPFPAWLVAAEVSKAVRVEAPDDLAGKLVELATMGALDSAQAKTVVDETRWTRPGWIEQFAGLGDVQLYAESWFRWVGRVDARARRPEAGMSVGSYFSPITELEAIAEVWFAAAKDEVADLPDSFDEVVRSATSVELHDRELKAPESDEQRLERLRHEITGPGEGTPAGLDLPHGSDD